MDVFSQTGIDLPGVLLRRLQLPLILIPLGQMVDGGHIAQRGERAIDVRPAVPRKRDASPFPPPPYT